MSRCCRTEDTFNVPLTLHCSIPGICGGLWDNLKQFADCIGVGDASCDGTDGNLSWQFTDGGSCNKGMVEATWYDATKNAYGAIECEED